MSARTLSAYTSIRTEGALLPADILSRIAAGDATFGGHDPASYHLDPSEKIGEATNRAWNRLQARWATFRNERAKLTVNETGASITRERWLLPIFEELKFGRLQHAARVEIDGKSYPISHAWHHVPIHLVGCQMDLDQRGLGVGAQRSSPHSLLQEFLNRNPQNLWGIVSNGLRLRLLRDNVSLTRQAYVEFDLEAMMDGEAYPDFVLLWLILHQSRFEGERPDLCRLEKWSQAARTEGVRVLDGLRDGVQRAIEHLGQGFLAHPANAALRARLRSGELDKQDYYRQLLRLVYRLLFLFVAEDRDLLLIPDADPSVQKRYRDHYATTRLRRLATSRAGSRHHDLYRGLKVVMEKLSGDGCPELALPALGSFLFSTRALPDLNDCDIANLHLLEAIRSLAVTQTGQSRRMVDYRNLGAEELGSVYESLLELHPDLNAEAASFELKVAAGSERKKTGSYYTPTSLISCLLDSALDPVLDEAAGQPDPETAILKLKVVDPACGSGHFLIAAAHRIAKRLAAVRTGEEEPPPESQRKALRDVIGHCIYGVDLNPMAVELCKVSLWMEALEPGKPLSFLEHRIQCGNSLIGAAPALLREGIPDGAFSVLTGDKSTAVSKWKKLNRNEQKKRTGPQSSFDLALPWEKLGNFAQAMVDLDAIDDTTIEALHLKEKRWREAVESSEYLDGKLLADAWCAAFVWTKSSTTDFPLTEAVFREIERNPAAFAQQRPSMYAEVRRLASLYEFFHWHLAFPEVFRVPSGSESPTNPGAGWVGGFDVVLGNPPWERVKLQEKEWFAARSPEIANAPNKAAREKLIRDLATTDPALHAAFQEALRQAEGESAIIRASGRYPLCGKGDINTYAIFAENNHNLLSSRGRMGVVIPSGIATDNTTKEFFGSLIDGNRLVSLYDFENAVGLFEGVGHGRFKFCLLTIAGAPLPAGYSADFFFFAHTTDDLNDASRHFTLTAEEIGLINPNTRTCPIFRSGRDAEITKGIYRRVPVLVNESTGENPWGISFLRMLDMSNDSHLFRTREQLEAEGWTLTGNVFIRGEERYLPLYEAKMMHQFNHRFGDYAMKPPESQDTELPRIPPERLADPNYVVLPRYWVPEWQVIRQISRVPKVLIQAIDAKSAEMAKEALNFWTLGYLLNHGHENAARKMFLQQLNIMASGTDVMTLDLNARKFEKDFPLDQEDLDLFSESKDPLDCAERLARKKMPGWLLGFRDIARSTDERTAIFSVLPPVGVGNSAPLITSGAGALANMAPNVSTLVFDYCARQKAGGTHLNFFIVMQLPILPPSTYMEEVMAFVSQRTLELTYCAHDMAGFARDLGYKGPPFRWDEERRFLIRCELDALYFHLYGINRDDADYILDTFPIVRRKDEAGHGEYRTKRVILEIYDAMAEAEKTGTPYQSRLNPPPADPRVAHQPHPADAMAKEQLP